MKENLYTSPECSVILVETEGILCASGDYDLNRTIDLDYGDLDDEFN